jgi:hypothetical protein
MFFSVAKKFLLFLFCLDSQFRIADPLIWILRNTHRSTTLSSGRYCTVIVKNVRGVGDKGRKKLCNFSRLFIPRLGKLLT